MSPCSLRSLSCLLLPLLVAALPFAAGWQADDGDDALAFRSGTYQVDPVHSSVVFSIRHAGIANFYGRFNDVSGSYVIDAERPEQCRVSIEIDPASVDTNHDGRDNHVRSADFLDVETHPRVAFESTAVRAAGANRLEVTGELELHGETHEVTAAVELVGSGEFRGYRSGVEAVFTIQRSRFGMTGMIGPLGDEVKLVVSLEGVLLP